MTWPTLYAGEDAEILIPNVRDSDGQHVLASATEAEFEVRAKKRSPGETDNDPSNPVILSKKLTTGAITRENSDQDAAVGFVPADTGELAGTFWADFFVTVSGKRRLARGPEELVIEKTVNRP